MNNLEGVDCRTRVMSDDFYLKTHLELISTPEVIQRRGENLHREFTSEIKNISPESVTE